jgi:hypothetical protein
MDGCLFLDNQRSPDVTKLLLVLEDDRDSEKTIRRAQKSRRLVNCRKKVEWSCQEG